MVPASTAGMRLLDNAGPTTYRFFASSSTRPAQLAIDIR